MSDDKHWRQLKRLAFEQLHQPFNKCLDPAWRCANQAIRAHSIQNSRVLDQLAVDGHLIMLTHMLDGGVPSIDFKRVGRNYATTFTGLCAVHDRDIFRPIDIATIDIDNGEHLFLLAFRSVLRELHTTMEWARRLQGIYEKRVHEGLSPKGKPDDAGMRATMQIVAAYETFRYKNRFDEWLVTRAFDSLHHEVVHLAETEPSIAVSSLSSDHPIRVNENMVRVCVNVFPLGGEMVAVFSCIRDELEFSRPFYAGVVSASGYHQKLELSKLVLRNCENLVISPRYYGSMTSAKRDSIRRYFIETLFRNDLEIDGDDIVLF